MVSAGRHPKKEIAEALKRAVAAGLDVNEIHKGHRWGEVRRQPCGASRDVYSTPRNPGTNTKQIDRFAQAHSHT
jgi:hypothetical protein